MATIDEAPIIHGNISCGKLSAANIETDSLNLSSGSSGGSTKAYGGYKLVADHVWLAPQTLHVLSNTDPNGNAISPAPLETLSFTTSNVTVDLPNGTVTPSVAGVYRVSYTMNIINNTVKRYVQLGFGTMSSGSYVFDVIDGLSLVDASQPITSSHGTYPDMIQSINLSNSILYQVTASDITAGKHFTLHFSHMGDTFFGTNYNPNAKLFVQTDNATNGGPFKTSTGLTIQLIDEP
jgi:hypothetical protein